METNLGISFIIKKFFPGHFGLINYYETVLLLPPPPPPSPPLCLSPFLSTANDFLMACRVWLPLGYRKAV